MASTYLTNCTSLSVLASTSSVFYLFPAIINSVHVKDVGAYKYVTTLPSAADGYNYISASVGGWVKESQNGYYTFEMFGAVGDGVTDDTVSIQLALDSEKEIHATNGKTYIVTPNQSFTNPEGGVGICLRVNSGQRLHLGSATIKQAAGTSGTAAIIANTVDVSNVLISGGIIDANTANTAGNMSAAVLWNATKSIITGVNVKSSRFIAVGFRNTASGYGGNIVENCTVDSSLGIGVQCANPYLGVIIRNNIIRNTTDNAIDVEGNAASGEGTGKEVLISGNICNVCNAGVFLESSGETLVSSNTITAPTLSAMYINRITSGAKNILITGNRFKGTSSVPGIIINNSSGWCRIAENTFDTFLYSISLTGNATLVDVGPNYHSTISSRIINVPTTANSAVWSRVSQQTLAGSKTNGVPYSCSPISNTFNYSTRGSLFTCSGMYALSSAASWSLSDDEYKSGNTGTLSLYAVWSAYAVYTGGDTRVYITSTAPTVGRYLLIGGYLYKVISVSSGDVLLRLASAAVPDGAAGDYTASPYSLNSAAAFVEYYTEWQTT